MKRFHICYFLAKELCSGVNINAKNYVEALNLFTKTHGDKEILYVTTLVA
jgi:hypothetical protein